MPAAAARGAVVVVAAALLRDAEHHVWGGIVGDGYRGHACNVQIALVDD